MIKLIGKYNVRKILTIYEVILLKANELYRRLEKDFIFERLTDVWTEYMGEVTNFFYANIKGIAVP